MLKRKLTFKIQIYNIIQNAKGAIKLVYPFIVSTLRLAEKLKIETYVSYVRSVILFGGPVWINASDTELQRLATLGTKTFRLILNYS